jgi:hypothetical protein
VSKISAPRSNREFIEGLRQGRRCRAHQAGSRLGKRSRRHRAPRLRTGRRGAPSWRRSRDYPGLQLFWRAAVHLPPHGDLRWAWTRRRALPEIGKEYLARTNSAPIAPVLVDRKDAPCKENILMGADVDLCKLPVPLVHDGDGGRYVGTWHAVVTKHPVRGRRELGYVPADDVRRAHHVGARSSPSPTSASSSPSTICPRGHVLSRSPPPSASRRWPRWRPARPRRFPNRNWWACSPANRRAWSSAKPTTSKCRPMPRSSSKAKSAPTTRSRKDPSANTRATAPVHATSASPSV